MGKIYGSIDGCFTCYLTVFTGFYANLKNVTNVI